MEPLLEIRNIHKVFHRRGLPDMVAVNHISFSLMSEECLGIVGESGSGKSTTVNMIVRLIDPNEGNIILGGKDITELHGKNLKDVYRKIQMVFQSPLESFNPRQKLITGITESLRNNGYTKADATAEGRKLLEMCGLPAEIGDRYPHQVSGGQCQRAAIARALAIKPDLLILDEATSALDVTVQKEIIELLNSLRKRLGLSILFISHDIALVQQFCDKAIVMYQGMIIERGTPDDIIRNPQHEYTKQLIDSVL